jgi:hypothetical protein
MKNRDIWPWGRRASVVAPAIAVGLSMAPSSASAQTVLPDINVIAPPRYPAIALRSRAMRRLHRRPRPARRRNRLPPSPLGTRL